jgi:hypothetical protein
MDFAAENRIRQRVLSMCVRKGVVFVLRANMLSPARSLALVRSFNKRQEEFGSAREYNDYLEQVEDIGARAATQLRSAHARRAVNATLTAPFLPLRALRARSVQPVPAHRRARDGGQDRGVPGGQRGEHHGQQSEAGARVRACVRACVLFERTAAGGDACTERRRFPAS